MEIIAKELEFLRSLRALHPNSSWHVYALKNVVFNEKLSSVNAVKARGIVALAADTAPESQSRDVAFRLVLKHSENLLIDIFVSKYDGRLTEEDPYLIANEYAVAHATDDINFIYGEIEYNSFFQCLRGAINCCGICGDGGDLMFVDLGHGCGKAVLAAAASGYFSHVMGIELVEGLNSAANEIVSDVLEELFTCRCGRMPSPSDRSCSMCKSPKLELHHGSFLSDDMCDRWTSADVVFANSTCFPDSLLEALSQKAERLRPGACVITFSSPLSSAEFDVSFD